MICSTHIMMMMMMYTRTWWWLYETTIEGEQLSFSTANFCNVKTNPRTSLAYMIWSFNSFSIFSRYDINVKISKKIIPTKRMIKTRTKREEKRSATKTSILHKICWRRKKKERRIHILTLTQQLENTKQLFWCLCITVIIWLWLNTSILYVSFFELSFRRILRRKPQTALPSASWPIPLCLLSWSSCRLLCRFLPCIRIVPKGIYTTTIRMTVSTKRTRKLSLSLVTND